MTIAVDWNVKPKPTKNMVLEEVKLLCFAYFLCYEITLLMSRTWQNSKVFHPQKMI